MSAKPVLEVNDLSVHFATRHGMLKAVDSLCYTVREGEIVALVGESGCGKSASALSLMRLIDSPPGKVGGQILLDGQDLMQLSSKQMRRVRGNDIAMVFQDSMTALNPVRKVGPQIAETLLLHKKSSTAADARRRSIELLDLVGIPSARDRLDGYPHEFSGGMRQRVMIAIALSCDPRVLIADEPTTALDVTVQAQIVELVKRLRAELSMSVVLISHDLGVVAGVADTVNIMYAGSIVESGPAAELFSDPRHPYTLGLLNSIPRIDTPRAERLMPIDGSPPELIGKTAGCPFEPRCGYSISLCGRQDPEVRPLGRGHGLACWVDVTSSRDKESV